MTRLRPNTQLKVRLSLGFQKYNGFQRFLKPAKIVKVVNIDNEQSMREHARAMVQTVLSRVPMIRQFKPVASTNNADSDNGVDRVDGLYTALVGDSRWNFILEVKHVAQPRYIRQSAAQLAHYIQSANHPRLYPILVGRWLSPESRRICEDFGVGFVDLAGNCRLAFDGVYVERVGYTAPKEEKSESKSLYTPKSSRALRLMLGNPNRLWKITDLAKATGISLGQASNVRQALLAREFARDVNGLMYLSNPRSLLEDWARRYKPPKGERVRYYTVPRDEKLLDVLRNLMIQINDLPPISRPTNLEPQIPKLVFAGTSASELWAPFVRASTVFLYAQRLDFELYDQFHQMLRPKVVDTGANLVVDWTGDEGIFRDAMGDIGGAWLTSPIQTYLDLSISGERAREAGQHLLEQRIIPAWRNA